MWIFGVTPNPAGGFWGAGGVCILGVILRLPAPLVAPAPLLFVSFALSLFNGEIKVAVQKNPKTR